MPNKGMAPEQTNIGSLPSATADLAEILRLSEQGPVRDPELLRRVEERSRRVQDDLRHNYGELDVAVDLIREIRDEE